MKAMVLQAAGAPFVMAELPDPVPGPGEAVARVLACGSGLTIQHVKAGRKAVTFPRVIGHEITGEIVAVGAGVEGLSVGDAVTAYYYLNCGRCEYCRNELEPLCRHGGGNVGIDCDGGYAEYIKLPAHIFITLPPELDHRAHPAEIGVVSDAIATPHKVISRARIRPGETVAVFGAGGGLGIHQLMMAKRAGARVIAVDTAAWKFDACRKAGADETVDPGDGDVVAALRDLTAGQGVDVVVDYVSATATLEAGVRALGRRGRLVTLGGAGQTFSVSALALLAGEQEILGSRYVTRREIRECLDLVARGEVWPLVSEIRPLAEAEIVHDKVERGEVVGRAAVLVG
ncbi:MAG: zinc-binding dehydrogenase [Rhodoplanes sp.]|uniref:alcohol dehydrogenase catalytic domain-containing protein n=1 Tax=Rhodoplanes sp. TaxID=1968906 RepID=UPI001790DD6C|nr:zinc-binding dehydrogenase [Rhodoplanes sp.]NVO12466.1 zinc-binding dehydrogenase [Rhodoplanes sp.]